ncbi:bifunctional phosphoribosyl-AMP cyclohydrolase/phosphoribosyl-ATP diphosphatase HisIE [Bacillus carboniphilus]|uniref:Histidine biosynthesis bifunctional protein HisIE n=1 Tax=Bacillus carboniphilus TaxID=86663 RepID=A0ABY9JPV9_9BACI|nr:bifunctional phosphoribosyl-AMP cyclohydrolase/phosphoribosyl-ATP diphosphatase HisIE [Bacillus carboniphilus]WLR41436.1 bifunctional phosphoribosyl-AMP cyclohydrolase/phosphoribosyl-ATP diphosphatase HisIE [Bacillus carboniphilus]
MNIEEVTFNPDGLVPTIIQDAITMQVLTLAYMNKEALQKTIETNEVWLYSRKRQQLWYKGETSGNIQHVIDLRWDCDKDALLLFVHPTGPACHTGESSCFKGTEGRKTTLTQLETIIEKRKQQAKKGSYTTYLFKEGIDKIAKKVAEEAAEVIIAAKNRNKEEVIWETADLFYHLLVLLNEQDVPLDEVFKVLEGRMISSEETKS